MADVLNWVPVCSVDTLDVGDVKAVKAGGRSLAIFRAAEDEFYATDDICSHGYAHLSQGFFEDCIVECPLHGGQFDVRTGKGLCSPIEKDIDIFQIAVEEGVIKVAIPVETIA
mgnify:CR=1 FL=1|jgi:MocE subfamily Rieske [2Fe-2S] domain protein